MKMAHVRIEIDRGNGWQVRQEGDCDGAEWFDGNLCQLPSASPLRKFASAMIAKIPLPLSRHIAATYARSAA